MQCENNVKMSTPKKQLPSTPQKQTLTQGNYSTQVQSPPQEFVSPQLNPWRTPKSLLKSAQKEQTPEMSPYSDRYIPFRQDNVSRNLFNQEIQPFEVDVEKRYIDLLNDNLLFGDDTRGTSILNFNRTQHQTQKTIQKQEEKRKMDSQPWKVLDAPGMEDDFYQDTLDWGRNNLVAVGLQRAIYLYQVETSKVCKLAEAKSITQEQAYYTSVQWNTQSSTLAIGCYTGELNLWDYASQQYTRKVHISQKRIAAISWANNNVLAYGCKDKSVLVADVRTPNFMVHQLIGHTQEVCGLAFDPSGYQLASGGNDNKVLIWQLKGGQEYINQKYNSWEIKSHKAAVRALAWNPHASGILATGGGNNDKTIKIHNTFTNTQMESVPVDSQVCKLRFSKTVNELVSTHGYEKNLVCIWSYPHLKKQHQLEGHQERVLFLSASPDETTILTGSGDETLKFWKIFPSMTHNNSSALFNICDIR